MVFTISLVLFCVSCSTSCLLEKGRSSVYLSVFEDLKPGELVGNLPFENSMDMNSTNIELKVVKGADLVDIVSGTNNLKLKQELDRDEGIGKFEAVIECKLSGIENDFNQLNISVFVTVKDINDNAPDFDSSFYNITIMEELPTGTIVFTDFEATDKDQPGPNSFIQYFILPGQFSDLLEIADPFKPVVTVKGRIDFEKDKSFEIQLEARDQGEPSCASTVPLRVTVEDANDLDPYFDHHYYIARKIQNGILVMSPEQINARDGDALNAKIRYTLDGELSSHFSIDTKGVIRLLHLPPPRRSTFFVHAYETDNENRNATAIISINLEENIRFEHNLYLVKVFSSTPKNTTLLTMNAFSTRPTLIRYSLRNSSDAFSIGEISGQLVFHGLENWKNGIINYEVEATDGEETATALVTVVIDTQDYCESKLEFEKSEYHLQIGSFSVLGTVKLKRQTSPKYKLMNMNQDFLIDPNGVLRLHQGARPACSPCELIVVANDEQGAMGITKIIIKNPSYTVPSISIITVLLLIILTLIFTLLLVFIYKRVRYVWRNHNRTNICWLNNANSSGITITNTFPKVISRNYAVNTEKDKTFESAKSPAPKRAHGAHLVPVTVTNQDGAPTIYF